MVHSSPFHQLPDGQAGKAVNQQQFPPGFEEGFFGSGCGFGFHRVLL